MRHPYPFCHAKRQTDVLGESVGKKYIYSDVLTFCLQSGSKENLISKEKIYINKNENLQRMHLCFPFYHGPFTRRAFTFFLRNQSAETGTRFALL